MARDADHATKVIATVRRPLFALTGRGHFVAAAVEHVGAVGVLRIRVEHDGPHVIGRAGFDNHMRLPPLARMVELAIDQREEAGAQADRRGQQLPVPCLFENRDARLGQRRAEPFRRTAVDTAAVDTSGFPAGQGVVANVARLDNEDDVLGEDAFGEHGVLRETWPSNAPAGTAR